MALKTGVRLRSQVDSTEVIVVKPPAGDDGLSCGGHPMIEVSQTPAEGLVPKPGTGTQIGKRYTSPIDDQFEVLVTKAGTADLSLGDTTLAKKEAKPLPASD
ncbi:hypothetical protein [Rhodococcoides yunnanense]|uniref:Uncharacterized protein n=1 Tax=Rhodococcoides yunnanense TaxID=278209 RepID=A0ABU4BKI5_9NOCA|nr:hypothetical protein [Rhodococcus yunnanensis]MDV6264732.1 hypothetical protein [Rhodococcus yunnanensis]